MRAVWALGLALLLAGCTAVGGEDPFAYTKKPLYSGGFDLARLAGATDAQEFRVTDGSIASIKIFTWINATAGGGHVRFVDPSGSVAHEASATGVHETGLQLGVWRVEVDAPAGSAGLIHVLVTRT